MVLTCIAQFECYEKLPPPYYGEEAQKAAKAAYDLEVKKFEEEAKKEGFKSLDEKVNQKKEKEAAEKKMVDEAKAKAKAEAAAKKEAK